MGDSKGTEEPPVLWRMTRLLAAGYQLHKMPPSNVVFLRHPARQRMRYWHLMLDSEGRIVGASQAGGRAVELRIRPDDHDRFTAFVRSVPEPTWWESHKGWYFQLLAGALPIALGLCVWTAVQVWRWFWGDLN
jgi:hypothetical protein